ncbi:hypothetical protein C5974_01255 [Cronobacter sakazakii]|nr:hypothetical protein C5974_01255 [Cronobacter sakazakii]PRV94586.1 hypothetical protein C6K71_05385 [Cronobacter sakazakii]
MLRAQKEKRDIQSHINGWRYIYLLQLRYLNAEICEKGSIINVKTTNELHQDFYLNFWRKDYYKRGCLRLSVLSQREGQKEESPGQYFY